MARGCAVTDTHPGKRPGWTRSVERYVVSYRAAQTRAERKRWGYEDQAVPVCGRRAVYIAPSGAAYSAGKLDRLWSARPRGKGALWSCEEIAIGGSFHGLEAVWLAPLRAGRVLLRAVREPGEVVP